MKMAPKVKKVIRSSVTKPDPKLNKSTLENSENKKNCSDWIETDEPLCVDNTVNSSKVKSGKHLLRKITFPSQSGSTRCPDDRKAKYTPKYYRRRLKYCKTLLRILIAAKTETCMKKYIEKSLEFIDENYKNTLRKNRSVQTDDLEDGDHPAPRIEATDANRDVRSLQSANKSQHDERDHESTMIPQREPHDHQNAKNKNLNDSSDDITIIETGQSKKESLGLRSKETKEASFLVADNEIDWPTIRRSQKNLPKSNPCIKEENEDRSSSGTSSSKSKLRIASGGKRNDEKAAGPSESKKCEHDKAKNLNPSEFVDKKTKTPTGGNHCLCRIKKLKSVPATTSTNRKVTSGIESPSASKLGAAGREKSGQDSDVEIVELSQIREKKTKKFYSPLELKYSEGLRSKFEGSQNNIAKEHEATVSKPFANKLSLSNAAATLNRGSINSQPVKQNSSRPLICGTYFSRYSIPVSIEINMVPDSVRAPHLSADMKQSKLTNYYSFGRSHGNKKVAGKNLSSNNFDENDYKIERKSVADNKKTKSRSLPVIQSNVLLQSQDEIGVFSAKYPLQRPKMTISRRQEYLYNLLNNYPLEQANTANQPGNQNIIFCDNVTLSQRYNVTNENPDNNNNTQSLNTFGNSYDSIVPPSYSISSDGENDRRNVLGLDVDLDSQQLTEMFAPWDKVDILEKVNKWNAAVSNADFSISH